jgi:multicomponent Na+:H+ antiporter subunit G
MIDSMIDGLSWICLVAGSIFVLVGGIGLLRLPDFYTRLHAAGITDTLGAGLILFGLALQSGLTLVTVKLILFFGFLVFTSPTSTHALTKAARHGELRPLLHDKEATSSNP